MDCRLVEIGLQDREVASRIRRSVTISCLLTLVCIINKKIIDRMIMGTFKS